MRTIADVLQERLTDPNNDSGGEGFTVTAIFHDGEVATYALIEVLRDGMIVTSLDAGPRIMVTFAACATLEIEEG